MNEVDVAETLKTLSARMDELSNALIEQKGRAVDKIKGNPFTYMGGAFIGGLALGYLIRRSRKS